MDIHLSNVPPEKPSKHAKLSRRLRQFASANELKEVLPRFEMPLSEWNISPRIMALLKAEGRIVNHKRVESSNLDEFGKRTTGSEKTRCISYVFYQPLRF